MSGGQKKRHSLLEACINIAIGYGIAMTANAVVLPAFGFPVNFHELFWITNIFTAISITRSYLVRRMFNLLHVKGIL